MDEVLLIIVGALLAVTVGFITQYYRHLQKVQKEYEKAKGIVEDIILSFNRQLKKEADRLERVTLKVEAVSSKGDKALKASEELGKALSNLEQRINVALEDREKVLMRLNEVSSKVRDTVASHESLVTKVSSMEEQVRRVPAVPEANIEAVIPIKREKALAPLTETELSVLEMLALEGSKTAPEIKDRIKLSREHTARLMKKLYEGGYLERDTGKIPFKYRVKEEMGKLLKKTESGTA